MTHIVKILIAGASVAALAAVFVLSPMTEDAASQAAAAMPDLPERPPTFEEFFTLAENNRVTYSLQESFFNNQTTTEAAERFITLADDGNMTAAAMLCATLYNGQGGITDKKKSTEYCRIAADSGKAVSEANLLYRNYEADPTPAKWQETYEAFTAMMEFDSGRAHLGLQFLYRQNHPKASGKTARYHLQKAIDYGDPFAMQALAELDLYGRRDYRNPARAERNLKKAYDLYNFDAGVKLAIKYRDGTVFERNPETYRTMIKRMAAFGHPKSLSALAEMYTLGNGVERDAEKAKALHMRAAKLGSKSSQRVIAFEMLKSADVSDQAEGVGYLEAYAHEGDVGAMMGLAEFFGRKDVDDPNNLKIHWLSAAAISGDQMSQEQLGMGYMDTGYIKEMAPYIDALTQFANSGDPEASFLLARHYRAASGVKRDFRKAQRILSNVAELKHPRCLEEQAAIEFYIDYFGSIDAVPERFRN